MKTLFSLESERARLTWSRVGNWDPPPFPRNAPRPGRLRVSPADAIDIDVSSADGAPTLPHGVHDGLGPRRYEQTDYTVVVESKTDCAVALHQRDPLLLAGCQSLSGGRIFQGVINFRQQVGLSHFTVTAGEERDFDFTVEVFPTKLDYESDFDELVADVQDILTALVLEYLRSTVHVGAPEMTPAPTPLEWLTLLRHLVDDLERALLQVERHPHRSVEACDEYVRSERVRRPDSALRRAVGRQAGTGRLAPLGGDLKVRERVPSRSVRTTLNTPEHRWIAEQVRSIQRSLAGIRRGELAAPTTARREQILAEIGAITVRIDRLSRIEPLAAARGLPPSSFASLQLAASPGYREAYRACIILQLGIRLLGGPLELSMKDLGLLFEYWCFLTVLRTVAEETQQAMPLTDQLRVRAQGLSAELKRGSEQMARFRAPGGRRIAIRYNPQFKGPAYLIPQKPDIVVTLEDPEWPRVHLILDAKYRLDTTEAYQGQYGAPGPPDDALNVLHRYRDAILELDPGEGDTSGLKRAVVQAAAVFPYRDVEPGGFRSTRLWRSLGKLGVGAVPLLPGSTEYLREWLSTVIDRGGWSIADRAISHRSADVATKWRTAAAEPVLVGTLRSGEEETHLSWVMETKLYYKRLTPNQPRQYAASAVALYSSAVSGLPGRVTHWAPVRAVEVMRRGEIQTPWVGRRDTDELQIVYHLDALRPLARPIENIGQHGRGVRMSGHRWSSLLAFQRARVLDELFLETEPEWRLYEDLQATGVDFHVRAGRPALLDRDDPEGRAWFVLPAGRIRYRGAAGFLWVTGAGERITRAREGDIVSEILAHGSRDA